MGCEDSRFEPAGGLEQGVLRILADTVAIPRLVGIPLLVVGLCSPSKYLLGEGRETVDETKGIPREDRPPFGTHTVSGQVLGRVPSWPSDTRGDRQQTAFRHSFLLPPESRERALSRRKPEARGQ